MIGHSYTFEFQTTTTYRKVVNINMCYIWKSTFFLKLVKVNKHQIFSFIDNLKKASARRTKAEFAQEGTFFALQLLAG